MITVLAISSWEYSSLIKIRHWLAKALYVTSSGMTGCLFFQSNAVRLVNTTFNCHVGLVVY